MKILITGGSGFIGSAILNHIDDHEFMAISRKDKCIAHHKNIYHVKSDLCEVDKWFSEAKKFAPDAVINLAWKGLPDYSLDMCRQNINMHLEFTKYILELNPKKYLMTGTCWEYGNTTGIAVESSYINNELCLFAEAKQALNRLISHEISQLDSIDFVWARVFFAYGQKQRHQSLIPFVFKKLVDKSSFQLKTPNQGSDFIYVDDVAKAILALVTTQKSKGIYNIGSGQMVTASQIAAKIKNIIEGDGSREDKIESQTGFYADIKKIKEDTGWEPETALDAGINLTVKALMEMQCKQ